VDVIPADAHADGGKKKDSRIPMTVKLEFELYERLKTHVMRLKGQGVRKSSQEILWTRWKSTWPSTPTRAADCSECGVQSMDGSPYIQ
jgi:hypothetical protein